MSNGKVLVTGGAGFIGSYQVDLLIKEGYKVVVVDDLSSGSQENLPEGTPFYKVDIRDAELAEVFAKERPDYVFHFAAQMNVNRSVDDPIFDADVNIIGSLNVLDNCVEYGVKKIMFSSTGGALYGEAEVVPTPEDYPCTPISPYGIAKLTVENYIRFFAEQHGLKYGITRYANVYGPRQNAKGEAGAIAIFTEKMLNRESLVLHGDGHQTRDFVFVGDVVAANLLVFESDKNGYYNVGTGRQTTINEIYKMIQNCLDLKSEPKHVDVFSGQRVSCLSTEKINQALGWSPKVKIEDGVAQTVEWFAERNN
ncbi:MAG: UDP-glucose 4-epimerase [Parcubacteria group bacterium GW2011_GWC2_38_7]|nr:MAG: UDP-glucose 4-epimerase [Parcubacteria group bacterium GW2011_GWC2_38_7]